MEKLISYLSELTPGTYLFNRKQANSTSLFISILSLSAG